MMPSMLLVSLYEFTQFLQIVLWIAVPATVIAIGLTIFFHYRRKKKQNSLGLAFQEDAAWGEPLVPNPAAAVQIHSTVHEQPEAMPDWLASTNPDNTPLLKKYEHEVRRYRENYALLEQDFRELEEKYSDLRNKAYHTDKATDTTLVKQLQQDIKAYQEKVSHLQQAAIQQRGPDEETQATLQHLRHDLQQREAENNRLQQLLIANQAVADEGKPLDERVQALQQLLEQAEAERQLLREKLEEQDYLPDILNEKKTEISFLQQQLELRIKNYHTLEHQANASTAQLSELRQTVAGLEHQANASTAQVSELRQTITGLEHQANASTAQASELHQTIAGLEQQTQTLHTQLEARQAEGSAWHRQLEERQQEVLEQQQQLEADNQQISRLEQELGQVKHSQQALQAAMSEKQALVNQLQDEVAREKRKAEELASRLDISSQLLMRIYSELSRSIDPHQLELTDKQATSPAEALLG